MSDDHETLAPAMRRVLRQLRIVKALVVVSLALVLALALTLLLGTWHLRQALP